jgi:hypothetical protein
VGAKSKAGEAA